MGKGIIIFEVPGQPIPKSRPRVMPAGWTYTPKKTRDAEKVVALAARKASGFKQPNGTALYAISIEFHRQGLRTADGDNLEKLVWDALSGVIWKNDHQVRQWSGAVFYSAAVPRTFIEIWEHGLKPSVPAAAHLGSC